MQVTVRREEKKNLDRKFFGYYACKQEHWTLPMSRWNYLYSPPFLVRQVIAAHYLNNLKTIIELGGWKSPISGFLSHDYQQIINIDPLIENYKEERLFHSKKDYREFDFLPYTKEPYGLVCLGFELPCSLKLINLCNKADRLVIEYPSNHSPSIYEFALLKPYLKLQLDIKLQLDLTDNDFGNLENSFPVFPHRTLYIFSNPN